jgi:isopentenyl phosphate kinase
MLTFVKLGGSLITDKNIDKGFRPEQAARVAAEVASALSKSPDLRLLLGHGSGSFGHIAAKQFGTMQGVKTPEQWRGFAHVATVAAELNHLMAQTLDTAGVPVWRMQPSASALAENGRLLSLTLGPIWAAIEHGLVPLVYGDVALDNTRGGTILSTETIFFYLARHLPVKRVLLLGEVEGVYDPSGATIQRITPKTLPLIEKALGGSAGTDVTGGMETKVRDMVALVEAVPGLTIRIMSGTQPGLLEAALLDQATPGTLISVE